VPVKGGGSLYVEVSRTSFKVVGKAITGGLQEGVFKTTNGFSFKVQLCEGVDEYSVRDIIMSAITKWLGSAPEVGRASIVSGLMTGRWEAKKPTLISEWQFLERLVDAIRASEFGIAP
jgi:hypothetical protein